MVIEQQFAAIGVNITPAHVEIEAPRLSMNITTEKPEMTIDRQAPTFEMDIDFFGGNRALNEPPDVLVVDAFDNEVFKDELKPYSELVDTDKRNGHGTPRKGSRIAAISRRKLMQSARRNIKIKTVPQNHPKIKWDPGYVHINWSSYRVNIDWEGEYIPEITVDPPYSIEIYLRNKPYFRITVEDGEAPYPYQAGQRVDEAV
jgi:hypothetical protein